MLPQTRRWPPAMMVPPVMILPMMMLVVMPACEEPTPPQPEPVAATSVESPAASASSQEPLAEASSAEPAPSASAHQEPSPPSMAADPKTTTGAAASVPAPEPVVTGAKTSEPEYSVWLQGPAHATAGKPSSLQAVLVANGEWKCNENYPIKMKLGAPPAGVSFPSPIATGASVTKKRASLAVPFVPSSIGTKTIQGTFHFSVCNASSCVMKKKALRIDVKVDES